MRRQVYTVSVRVGATLHPLLRVLTRYVNKLCPFVLDLTRFEDKLAVFEYSE